MQYTIVAINPKTSPDQRIFNEIAAYMAVSLYSIGKETFLTENFLQSNGVNVLVGWHNYPDNLQPKNDYIILQLENLHTHDAGNFAMSHPASFTLLNRAREIWDYDLTCNRSFYEEAGICLPEIKPFVAGHHSCLEYASVARDPIPNDILFLGDNTPRRKRILSPLIGQNPGNIFCAKQVYGMNKANLIAGANSILSLHRDEYASFEMLRAVEAWSNKKNLFMEGCKTGPYGEHLQEMSDLGSMDNLDYTVRYMIERNDPAIAESCYEVFKADFPVSETFKILF